MKITQARSAPLVAMVGATGVQGGSVIKALSESEKPYRIRGFTRDLTKATAEALKKQGVEMIAVNFIPENKGEVYKAFAGADYTFLVTNYWEHAKKGQCRSNTVLDINSNKKNAAGANAFDGKALVTEYGRASGVPVVDVQAGFYATNLLWSRLLLAKQPAVADDCKYP
ncbi:NmrA-like protein [Mycena albidolilacea]|uniref:NmrA-like protein n=1 Tax=Mycena albidolilacea TaxID=1033008 RepID=A0AAD7A852_9AGAR|nr:NmrA-like protein [Mycena albidolilacea]